MSKLHIEVNRQEYPIDESVLASASADLKSHLSSVMNGAGATINFGGTAYDIDSAKLSSATSSLISHLDMIEEDGEKIVVSGIEHSISSKRFSNIVNNIENSLDRLSVGGAGGAIFRDGIRLSWDELQLTENGTKYKYNASMVTDTSIGEGAFQDCGMISKVIVPNSVTSVGRSAFADCSNLKSITIPNNIISIGFSAFLRCSNLKNITIPFVGGEPGDDTNTYLGFIFGAQAWSENLRYVPTSLTTVTITGGSVIDDKAFNNCTSLTSVTIPDSVTSIGEDVFLDCDNLQTIYYTGTMEQWISIQKNTAWDLNAYIEEIICSEGTLQL